MKPILELKQVFAGYGDSVAIKDITLSIEQGEILCVVGESGSGKSSLIKAISQLNRTNLQVTSGEILFSGKNLLEFSERELGQYRGHQIGLVSQNPTTSLNPLRKIKHQFADTICSHSRMGFKQVLDESRNILQLLQFEDPDRILNAYPYQLSGGMNQRVSIALAMVMKPKLLLADEPTSALDVTIQAQVARELLDLRNNFQTSICLITHNLGLAAFIADRIAVIQNGQIVEYGNKHEVIKHPCHEYTKTLIQSVPKLGKPIEGLLA